MLVNRKGDVLEREAIRNGTDLGDRDLREALFTAMVVDGLELSGADLRNADFSLSNLYWLNLFSANCKEASFRGATLEGANFKSACLMKADFSSAIVAPDRLGRPSSFAHADLTDANLDGAILNGTEYDAETVWPIAFVPEAHGLVLVAIKDDWLKTPSCK